MLPRPVTLSRGEGEILAVGGSSITLKATGESTTGSFFLSETLLEPEFPGPPPHRHRRLHDMFYVLEGTLTMRLAEKTVELGPGAFVCIPPGIAHTFSNRSGKPVRMLDFNTPAGWKDSMRDLGEAFSGDTPPTSEEIGRIASTYDFEVVG